MLAIATTVSTTVLKSVPLFASFPDEQLRTLVSVVTIEPCELLSVTKRDFKMIGASREMVSRVMRDLQMGGYIETRGSSIVPHDTTLLRD